LSQEHEEIDEDELEKFQAELLKLKALITDLRGRLEAVENMVYKRPLKEDVKHEQAVPDFNAKSLMEHKWKGKKLGHRHWAEGSLGWGWDFTDQFAPEVIEVLQKGPLTIDGYIFSLGNKVVNVKKEGIK